MARPIIIGGTVSSSEMSAHTLLTITPEGRIEPGPGLTMDAVAQEFLNSCSTYVQNLEAHVEAAEAEVARLREAWEVATACGEALISVVRPMYSGPTGDQGLNDPRYGTCLQAIERYKRARAALAPLAPAAEAEVARLREAGEDMASAIRDLLCYAREWPSGQEALDEWEALAPREDEHDERR